jgi:hypothetical protein
VRGERAANRKIKVQPSQEARIPLAKPQREPSDHYTEKSYRRAVADACDRAFPHPTLSAKQRRLKSRSKKLSAEQKAKLTADEKSELKEWRKPTDGSRTKSATRGRSGSGPKSAMSMSKRF